MASCRSPPSGAEPSNRHGFWRHEYICFYRLVIIINTCSIKIGNVYVCPIQGIPIYIYKLHLCNHFIIPWWRHQMETFSALLAICAGNSPVSGECPTQRPVTRSFDAYFDLRPNKRLSKQSWGWWFETLSPPLWRHRNALYIYTAWSYHISLQETFIYMSGRKSGTNVYIPISQVFNLRWALYAPLHNTCIWQNPLSCTHRIIVSSMMSNHIYKPDFWCHRSIKVVCAHSDKFWHGK